MRKLMMIAFSLALFLNLLNVCKLHSQGTASETKIGLSASLQSGQLDMQMPIRIDRFSFSPAFGFVWSEDAATDLRFGVLARVFLSEGKVLPFAGIRFGVLWFNPDVGDGVVDLLVGLAGGGEYFLDEHFSFGVESQLNFAKSADKSSRFGNPGKMNLNTAAAVFATIYF